MSIMVSEVYDALREAGASDEKSRAAAQAIVDYDQRFNRIDAELKLHRLILTLVLGGVIALILKSFFGA
ncbi:hypothetical protein P8S54_07140 [Thiomicrospira sp. R3]|uniref:hypothetical protein n=1 Tax=Thiomicrospira sp. R3 TaxID=3035472 RepID=UPI00259BA5B7|nr:hypothetical protein [Thiomicrospira sp. R3]WFE68000.1 hypothetical protein P8S54_07140 [Thiomicrospira sp. R3]